MHPPWTLPVHLHLLLLRSLLLSGTQGWTHLDQIVWYPAWLFFLPIRYAMRTISTSPARDAPTMMGISIWSWSTWHSSARHRRGERFMKIYRRRHHGWRVEMNTGSFCTCSKLVGGDSEGLYLQSEGVEGERWCHHQSLLCVAHVGVAQRAVQVAQAGVTGWKRSCGAEYQSVNEHHRSMCAHSNVVIPAMSDQLACNNSPLRWYLLLVEFFKQEKCDKHEYNMGEGQTTYLPLSERMDALTKVKVKLSKVSCCVRDNVALLESHNPDEFVTLGLRFTNVCTVWEGRHTRVLSKLVIKDGICFLLRGFLSHKGVFYLVLWTRKVGDVELQPQSGQKTCAVVVDHRVSTNCRGPCRRGCRGRGGCWYNSGGWSCCGGLVCHTCAFCDEKVKSSATDWENHKKINKTSAGPLGLRSFPGMYASSLMLEKVTVAPPTWKGTELKQR